MLRKGLGLTIATSLVVCAFGSTTRAGEVWVEQVAAVRSQAGRPAGAASPTNASVAALADARADQAPTGTTASSRVGHAETRETRRGDGIALVRQGQDNVLLIDRDGSDHTLSFVQSGDNNSITATVTGTGNALHLQQSGSGNIMVAMQSGSNNSIAAVQSGQGNVMRSVQR